MEMILVIFFFSICAAICVNIFASAKTTSEESVILNSAVLRCTDAAEVYKSADGDLGEAAEIMRSLDDPEIKDIEASIESVSLTYVPEYGEIVEYDRTTQVTVRYTDDMIVRILEHKPGRSSISVWASAPDGTADEVYYIEVRSAVSGTDDHKVSTGSGTVLDDPVDTKGGDTQ